MAHQYFCEGLSSANVGALVELVGDEAHHAAKVSRVRPGERLLLTDGYGARASVFVEGVTSTSITCRIESLTREPPQSPEVTLVQALAKTDRDERAIEAATELGVTEIIPWQAHRSVSRWVGEKREKGRLRWQTLVREATKQSLRSWTPVVRDMCETAALITALAGRSIIVLDPRGTQGFSSLPDSFFSGPIAVVVGPEGGISDEELVIFSEAGARVVTLGSHILRTSTAGPALLAMLNERCSRW